MKKKTNIVLHIEMKRFLSLLVLSFSLSVAGAQTYESYIEQGLAAAQKKHYDEAIEQFRQALRTSPDDIRNALTYANIAHIQELQYTIDNAEIVDDESISVDEIGMSSKITIKRLDTGKIETFTIVGTNHANVREGLISDESPIGKAAMKKRVGDIFIVEAPAGELKFEVVEISK